MAEPQIHFGPFTYDPGQRALFREGQLVPLGPKTIDLLHLLLEERGRVVDKADLLRRVWPDTTVEEVGLARNVSLLRKALGDDAEQAVYIETVPRRGYRFIAEVHAASPATPAPAHPPPARPRWLIWACGAALALAAFVIYWQFYAPGRLVARGDYVAVAVIPFESLGSGAPGPAFVRGLEESLAARFAHLNRVQVTSPGTIHRYRDKGIPVALMSRLLRLDAVLEGTLQRNGDRLHITARLADVPSGKLIWADSYDLPLTGAPTEAATRIAAEVGPHLQSPQSHP